MILLKGMSQSLITMLFISPIDTAKMDIPVPGKRYKYQVSPDQPPNENKDYFPICNVK